MGQLLPLTLFAFTVFTASAVVTACSPTRGSTMKDQAPSAAQANLKSNPTPATPTAQNDLQKKLSGPWQCFQPKDSSTPCFGQSLNFSDYLDKMSENTFISLDDDSGKCRVEINYSLTVNTDKNGIITLQLGSASLGNLVDDPSNDDSCGSRFQDSTIPNLSRHQQLTHSDDWSQIVYDGVTYTRPASSTKTNQAETWPNP